MATKTFTISDDGEIVQTLDGFEPKHLRSGPDLCSAMNGPQVRRQARHGEALVGAMVLDEHGNVADEVTIGVTDVNSFRQSVMIEPSNSSLESISRREAFLRERLADITNPDGSPKLDDAGRDIYRDERYKLTGELALLAAEKEFEAIQQQRREAEAAVLAQQDAIARELAARQYADDEASAKLAEHLSKYYPSSLKDK